MGRYCWCSSTVEQRICNPLVGGSNPFTSFENRKFAIIIRRASLDFDNLVSNYHALVYKIGPVGIEPTLET